MNSINKEKYEKEHVTSFPIEAKKIGYTTALPDTLKNLRTTARKFISATETKVTEGYTVEPIMAGLSLPTDLAFAEDGTLFISEGGSSWPTRPYMPARVIRMKPNGEVVPFK